MLLQQAVFSIRGLPETTNMVWCVCALFSFDVFSNTDSVLTLQLMVIHGRLESIADEVDELHSHQPDDGYLVGHDLLDGLVGGRAIGH